MKYVRGLYKSIRKKLKLFKDKDISKANMKTMRIEDNNWPRESKKDDKFKKGNVQSSQKKDQGKKQANTTQKFTVIIVTFIDILKRRVENFI